MGILDRLFRKKKNAEHSKKEKLKVRVIDYRTEEVHACL